MVVAKRCREELRQAHIDDDGLRGVHGAEHDVLQLEVSVHDALAVAIGDALADLVKRLAHPLLNEPGALLVRLLNNLGQLPTREVVSDQVQGIGVRVVLEKSEHRRVIQGLQFVDFLHDHLRVHAALHRSILVNALQHARGPGGLAEHLLHDAEGALTERFQDLVVVGGLAGAPAHEHVAAEGHRLFLVQLREEEVAVDLVKLVFAKDAVGVRVEAPHAVRQVAVAEGADAEANVHVAHALDELIEAERAVAILVHLLELL
mmetsp:Transcript_146559/g.468110  ORF Transcript_146559/g.468110 Transcript_146559/m.468110 type:complete len:261 (-) Transcript_146559:560-1342(-)